MFVRDVKHCQAMLNAPQVANVISGRRAALHVAQSDLYQSFLGTWSASKFVGDLGWSSFALGSLGACSAASGAHGNRHQHVDVQSGAWPLWCGALDVRQGISWDVPQVFAREFEWFDLLSELVRMVQWHAWPVVAPTCCPDLRPRAGRLCGVYTVYTPKTNSGGRFRWRPSRYLQIIRFLRFYPYAFNSQRRGCDCECLFVKCPDNTLLCQADITRHSTPGRSCRQVCVLNQNAKIPRQPCRNYGPLCGLDMICWKRLAAWAIPGVIEWRKTRRSVEREREMNIAGCNSRNASSFIVPDGFR